MNDAASGELMKEDGIFYKIAKYGGIFVLTVIALVALSKTLVVRQIYDKLWKLKYYIYRIFLYFFPNYDKMDLILEADTGIPKVNCEAIVVIENLPKCTTAKDLVKCLGLKELVQVKKLMKLSVAADKKGQCAGLAVAVVPRYCLHHSLILTKHKSVYRGNVIKIKEVRNRKIKILKQVNWLSSANSSHVGLHGRFQVYNNILQEAATQFGYYLIDGGSYVQYCTGDVESIMEESSACGIEKIVLKVTNLSDINKTEIAYCKKFPGYLYTTAGASHTFADKWSDEHYYTINSLLENPLTNKFVAAIGECGISVPIGYSQETLHKQKNMFSDLVQLANKFHKPLLVRSLRNVDIMLEILDKFPNVTACLSIGYQTPKDKDIQAWINKGHYLGVSGSVWAFYNQNFWIPSIIKTVPLDKIILCSNSPFLLSSASKEHIDFITEIKGCDDFKHVSQESIKIFQKRNEETELYDMVPRGLCVVLELLASCLHTPPSSLAQIVNTNAEKFYKFDSLR